MSESKQQSENKQDKKIISHRKNCDPKGTGLSHYIIVDEKKVRKQ